MATRATGTVETKAWQENTYAQSDSGATFTRASVSASFGGDIEGEGAEEYLMVYLDDNSASFVGLEHVDGSIVGRSGSFVIQHNGTFADGKLESNWFVVPGSGTGELHGLRGEGTYTNEGGESRTAYTLDYHLD